ncbi:hypothetical protein [Deefgea rivuli]|uniref:hypothetical protein n=1 Tax=Deefgea rivuli TaxID=400948 RepID=UPI0012EBA18F|nr:hypothetical protein [Deefgea rivuli]
MKSLLNLVLGLALSAPALVHADPQIPEQMMRGRSSQYQDGFRDGFREAVQMMNNGGGNMGGGGNHWERGIRIISAVYGTDRGGSCDLTRKLAHQANGKKTFNFASNDSWCGDPAVGHVKYANIVFSCNGREHSESIRQERSSTLRCY